MKPNLGVQQVITPWRIMYFLFICRYVLNTYFCVIITYCIYIFGFYTRLTTYPAGIKQLPNKEKTYIITYLNKNIIS